MADIRTQRQLYHLTDIQNLASIFRQGLLPRSHVQGFSDVADQTIIVSRRTLRLETYVPFHFFAKNPFDGRVQRDHPQRVFALLVVLRTLAEAQNWKIIPTHPLATGNIQLLDYQQGMQTIDWALMNQRDYSNELCRLTCMAECLSPNAVAPTNISSIYVKDAHSEQYVSQLMAAHNINCYLNVNPQMFVGT